MNLHCSQEVVLFLTVHADQRLPDVTLHTGRYADHKFAGGDAFAMAKTQRLCVLVIRALVDELGAALATLVPPGQV